MSDSDSSSFKSFLNSNRSSLSDSDSSSHGGAGGGRKYKTFRQITRERLLFDMIRSTRKDDSKLTYKVLIMDKMTTKIMSCSCKMGDINDQGVPLVEHIKMRRQPLPTMDAIYFIEPTKENVLIFMSDMSGGSPLYKKAFVFFSSPVPRELLKQIQKEKAVSSRLAALTEMNLEYFAIDSQGFVTDHESALEELFGDDEEISHEGKLCLDSMASRIASVFASMREFPRVRFRAAKALDPYTMTTFRDFIPTKLASGVWNCLMNYKAILPNYPQEETCDLLIIDRSVDQVAPIIHEWTYDAMCHDLLNISGNKYVHVVENKDGVQKNEVLLEDHDPLWVELRHVHIADASLRLDDKAKVFATKNKHFSGRDANEFSTRELKKMVNALPEYCEKKKKLSIHVDIATKINTIIRETGLREVGELEQGLVFGDAGTKDLIKFLRTKPDITRENKLRLLMIYAAVHPESDKLAKLVELSELPQEDLDAVYNMRLIEGAKVSKKNSSPHKRRSRLPSSLTFDVHKKKKHSAVRKDRSGEEEAEWQLSRFHPVIEELVEKLSAGNLAEKEYPSIKESTSVHSVKSKRTPSWARRQYSDDGYSSSCSDSSVRNGSSHDFKNMGKRIFVFIIGGATRSEIRVCHKLTEKLKREVILGSSSLDDPAKFITKLKKLSPTEPEISLDDLEI